MSNDEKSLVLLKPGAAYFSFGIMARFLTEKIQVVKMDIVFPTKEQVEQHLSFRPNSFEKTAQNVLKRCQKENIPIEKTLLANKNAAEVGDILKKLTIDYMISSNLMFPRPLGVWIVQGPDVINRTREICGSTFPGDADPASIRGYYATSRYTAETQDFRAHKIQKIVEALSGYNENKNLSLSITKKMKEKVNENTFEECILNGMAPQNLIHSAECYEEAFFQAKIWMPDYKF